MKQEEFISTEELFNAIKEDFNALDNNNLVDEGKFYNHVAYIIKLLGVEWYREEEDVFNVENYRFQLPRNFSKLSQAYKCTASQTTSSLPPGVVLTNRQFDHVPDECNTDPCSPHFDTNCIFNRFDQILVQRSSLIHRYTFPILLRVGNKKTRSLCSHNCPNIFSEEPDEITIENGYLYTNFQEGNVYLSYYAFPLDAKSGLPVVPNNEIIIKCIEYYIKWKLLENMWVNADGDVANKIAYFQAQYREALGDAQHETKLPHFGTLVNKIRSTRRNLNIYQLTRY